MREDFASYEIVDFCELGELRSSDWRGVGLDFVERPSTEYGRKRLSREEEEPHAMVAALLGPSAAGLLDLRAFAGRSLVFLDRSVVLIVRFSGLGARAVLSLLMSEKSGVLRSGRE